MVRKLRWLAAGLLYGAGIGLVVLGIGGRIAMRGIAIGNGAAGLYSFEGTLTVVLAGAASGAAGGAIRALLDRIARLPVFARTIVFVLACFLLTLRGLKPLDNQRLILFLPIVALYVTCVEVLWRRRLNSSRTNATRQPSMSAV